MIVITGGAGFIGSNLTAALAERGERDLVVCDRLGGDDKWRNLAKHEIAETIAPEELAGFLEAQEDAVKRIHSKHRIDGAETQYTFESSLQGDVIHHSFVIPKAALRASTGKRSRRWLRIAESPSRRVAPTESCPPMSIRLQASPGMMSRATRSMTS